MPIEINVCKYFDWYLFGILFKKLVLFDVYTGENVLEDEYDPENEEGITYEEYIKNEEIQKLLKELELDKDKFWFLILFAYDYSESLCINGVDVAPSAYEQLQTLINAINPCVTDFDLENGSTIDREIKMEVRIEGMKKPIIIDSPTAIHLLIDSCETRMEEDNNNQIHS